MGLIRTARSTLLSAFLLAIVATTGCKDSVDSGDAASRRRAVEQTADPSVLARVATQDRDASVRFAAVRKITDAAVLAGIATTDVDAEVRIVAIGKVSDPDMLAGIAVKDKDPDARRAALGKLIDQVDQLTLAKTALGINEELEAATARAPGDDDPYLAVAGLKNQALLRAIAERDTFNPLLRSAAIAQLTDQKEFRRFATDPAAALRGAAVKRIDDDAFLLERLAEDTSPSVRQTVAKSLRTQAAIKQVAMTAYNKADRETALSRINDADEADKVREALAAVQKQADAFGSGSDSNDLVEQALHGRYDIIRYAAAKQLSRPDALLKAASQAQDRDVLKILLPKMSDPAALTQLADTAADSAMRLAAAQKSGKLSWTQMFDEATAKGAPEQALGDALAAVSLFEEVQEDARSGVEQACLNMIRHGDESRIPEMVDLLNAYGNTTLCEDYLNCGQPDLDAAGRSWAAARGYNVNTGYGSNRADWGSDR